MSDSLNLQNTRLPCPSPSPGVCSNSCPLSQWCHPAIRSSVVPFLSRLQPFPASRSFLMSQLFASGSQSIGASASVLPVNIQGGFPLGLTGLISLLSKGISRVFSNTTVQKPQFVGTINEGAFPIFLYLSLWVRGMIELYTWAKKRVLARALVDGDLQGLQIYRPGHTKRSWLQDLLTNIIFCFPFWHFSWMPAYPMMTSKEQVLCEIPKLTEAGTLFFFDRIGIFD